MRKRYVSDEELNQIIKLKQSGASWLRIQDRTGVPRRSAGRAYADWLQNQSSEELKSARINVAAEIFREHVESLIELASLLVNYLDIPEVPNEARSSTEYLNYLLAKDFVGARRELQIFKRQKQLLFKSLREHTRGKVRWKAQDEWEEAWDRCIMLLAMLNEKAREATAVFANQKKNPIKSIMLKGSVEDAKRQIMQAILNVVWQNIVDDKLNPESPDLRISYQAADRTLAIFKEKESIEKMAADCSSIANSLCIEYKDDIIKLLILEARRMRNAVAELAEILNPLILRPIILRTRCELCPA